MAKVEETLIDIQVDTATAISNIRNLNDANDDLRNKVKEERAELEKLKKAINDQGSATLEQGKRYKELSAAIITNNTQIKDNNAAINANTREIAYQIEANKDASGSINELRKAASLLTAQYSALSKEERESTKGQQMAKSLGELNSQINETMKGVNSFKDNIGNYRGSLEGVIQPTGALGDSLKLLGFQAGMSAKEVGVGLLNSLKSLGTTMLALAKNPIFVALTVAVGVVTALSKAFQTNGAAMDKLQQAFAPFQRVLDNLFRTLGRIGEFIADLILKFSEFLFGVNNEAKELAQEQQNFVVEEAKLMEKRAETARKNAELSAKVADRYKYTAKERKAFQEELLANEIELQTAEKKLATDKYEHYMKENKLSKDELETMTHYTDKQKEEVRKLRTAIIESDTKIEETRRASNKKLSTIYAEELALTKEHNAKVKAEKDQRLKDEQDAAKKLEDHLRRSMAVNDTIEKASYKLTEQSLKLKEVQKEHELQIELDAIDNERAAKEGLFENAYQEEQFNNEMRERELAAYAKYYENLLSLEKEYHDNSKKELEYEKAKREDEIKAMTDISEYQKESLINASNASFDKEIELLKASYDKTTDGIKAKKNIELTKSKRENTERIVATKKEQLEASKQIVGDLTNLLNTLGEKNKAFAAAAKVLQIGQIMADMAVGISDAIVAGAKLTFPANLGAIAMGVSTVVAGITSAIALFNKSGDSGTTASVPSVSTATTAAVEAVTPEKEYEDPRFVNYFNASQTAESNTPEAANNNLEVIANRIETAIANMPAPVVSVQEINNVQNSVSVKEHVSRI